MSKPDLSNIKVTIANEVATLSGIDYQDLRYLLTMASLHHYDNPPNISSLGSGMDEMTHSSNIQNFLLNARMRLILNVIEGHLANAISPQYGKGAEKISSAEFMYECDTRNIEDDVRALEIKAAAKATGPDDTTIAMNKLSEALRLANMALAEFTHARVSEIRHDKNSDRGLEIATPIE